MPAILQANISTNEPKKRIKEKLLLETLIFDALCKKFEEKKGWKRPSKNPFLEREPTPFKAVWKVGNKNVGCEVKQENETTKFALLGTDKASLDALYKCVEAYDTAHKKWKTAGKEPKKSTISYTLTVDEAAEIRPILEALAGVCHVKEILVRDKKDPNKTKPLSAEEMERIQNAIQNKIRQELREEQGAPKVPKGPRPTRKQQIN